VPHNIEADAQELDSLMSAIGAVTFINPQISGRINMGHSPFQRGMGSEIS
jgi:hypothetical protein